MTILHIITSLDRHGAQAMLHKICASQSFHGRSVVVVLKPGGPLKTAIEETQTPVYELNLSMKSLPRALNRVKSIARQHNIRLIQTWLYHGDFFGSLLYLAGLRLPQLWNIRHSDLSPETKLSTRLVRKGCAFFSRFIPRQILANSQQGIDIHVGAGYDQRKMVYVPNGFDVTRFKPSLSPLRQELGMSDESAVIGYIARFHPQKDHGTFFRAMEQVYQALPSLEIVLCGDGTEASNSQLLQHIPSSIQSKIHFLGRRSDVVDVYNALDIVALSASAGEGFPNVIGEAMACAKPIVATNVGAVADIMPGEFPVVDIGDADAFANHCIRLLSLNRQVRNNLGQLGRTHLMQHFSIDLIAKRYDDIYTQQLAT